MRVHSLLVESVDLRSLGGSASGHDFLGDSFDGCQFVPGQKDLCPLGRNGAYDSAAAPPSGSVDHRNLVLQQHIWFLSYTLRPTAETHLRVAAFFAIRRGPDRQSRRRYRHHNVEKMGALSRYPFRTNSRITADQASPVAPVTRILPSVAPDIGMVLLPFSITLSFILWPPTERRRWLPENGSARKPVV